MTDASTIFLAGASQGVGREIAHCLSQQSFKVIAFLRSEDSQAELEAMGMSAALGDALDLAAVEQAMLTKPIYTVITTIGGLPKDGRRADYWGNKNLIDTAVKAKVQKFILISSIGSGNSAVALPPQALETLGPVLAEKAKAEQYLTDSGLTYIIIRPGGLKSEPATGNGILTENPTVAGTIHRADVAQLVCRCLTTERANHKVLSAIDRQMLYGQPKFEEFSLD